MATLSLKALGETLPRLFQLWELLAIFAVLWLIDALL